MADGAEDCPGEQAGGDRGSHREEAPWENSSPAKTTSPTASPTVSDAKKSGRRHSATMPSMRGHTKASVQMVAEGERTIQERVRIVFIKLYVTSAPGRPGSSGVATTSPLPDAAAPMMTVRCASPSLISSGSSSRDSSWTP